jgi:glycosyltransferase involved in cell wall biosynthesis
MVMPSTSILITAYNVEKYIGRAVRSALNQSVERGAYEVIVVNDCSEDRTRFALEVFEDEIRVINNEARQGLPASLNRGIRKARGQFIVRVDGDDYVHGDFVKIMELHLRLNEGMDAVACDYLMVDDEEHILGRGNPFDNPIACGIMFRVGHLIDIGLYDEKFLCLEDEDLRLRFLKKRTIERVALPLYRYRKHNGNMTNNRKRLDFYRTLLDRKHNGTE